VNKTNWCTIFLYVYFYSVHISVNYVPIIRRNNYINATPGNCHSVWMTVWHAGWDPILHARPRPTALLPPRSNGKIRRCYWSCWAPDDGREDVRNMLSRTQTSGNKLGKLLHLVGWFIGIVWWCTDLQTLNLTEWSLLIEILQQIEVNLHAPSLLYIKVSLPCQRNKLLQEKTRVSATNTCAQLATLRIQTLYEKKRHQHSIHMSLPLCQRNKLFLETPMKHFHNVHLCKLIPR